MKRPKNVGIYRVPKYDAQAESFNSFLFISLCHCYLFYLSIYLISVIRGIQLILLIRQRLALRWLLTDLSRTAGEKASMSWTWTYTKRTGAALLSHALHCASALINWATDSSTAMEIETGRVKKQSYILYLLPYVPCFVDIDQILG